MTTTDDGSFTRHYKWNDAGESTVGSEGLFVPPMV